MLRLEFRPPFLFGRPPNQALLLSKVLSLKWRRHCHIMIEVQKMDAHSRSPAGLREDFRRWRGSDPAQIESSSDLIDLSKYKVDNDHVCPVQMLASRNDIEEAFIDFNPAFPQSTSLRASTHGFELKDFPGARPSIPLADTIF